ncbi:hypothetical protein F4779DRAFT_640635 [Xylariaceae sp. FL0662B]|nr:hypothetical protein F4779DRAFT_640635 [Xylariaceae sp. FL0662B]
MALHRRSHASKPMANHASLIDWRDGDIAFLKSQTEFTQAESCYMASSNYLQPGATGHPVIILERSQDSEHFLVTTVSAYGSGEGNQYLPPWKQIYHQRKSPNDFRAFVGSARPHNRQKYLYLENDECCPKVKTSWVYIRSYFVVPRSMLKRFDKAPRQLRMTEESLTELLDHMDRANRYFGGRWSRQGLTGMPSQTPSRAQGNSISRQPWASPRRQNDRVTRGQVGKEASPGVTPTGSLPTTTGSSWSSAPAPATPPKHTQPTPDSAATSKTGATKPWSMVAASQSVPGPVISNMKTGGSQQKWSGGVPRMTSTRA